MREQIAALEPRALWSHFADLTAIPRPSKHEQRVVDHVRRIAADHGFTVREDATGNLVLVVPATPGREDAAPVIIQSHLDMVCEKNRDVDHDFMTEGIRPVVDGDWVGADGTTLGADNGIGVAAALAVATDPEVAHGPLELLFTLDEETGLTGAKTLDPSLLRGRILLNLDSEEDGAIFVGCAGGADTRLELTVGGGNAPVGRPYRLEVRGLRGGHSGMNIGENRGNAVRRLALVLAAMGDAADWQLAGISGGDKHNAIPREAEALLLLSDEGHARLQAAVASAEAAAKVELAGIDEGITFELAATDHGGTPWSRVDALRVVRLLTALPHGVLAMSGAIEGLVETSSNLAAVASDDGRVRVLTSTRSSVMPALERVLQQIGAVGALAGAEVRAEVGYPGWKPNLDSPVLAVVRGVYAELWQREPEVTAIHAGLECGLIGEKIPGLDMVSFGPQIEGAHSPDERVSIASVARFWNALTRVLDRLG